MLIVGSGNSMELGVLGCQSENNWLQWVQEDASRAELPLAKSHQEETFPIGLTVDTSIQYTLPWGNLSLMSFLFVAKTYQAVML